MIRFVLILAVLLTVKTPAFAMEGDPRAIAMARQLIDKMGGAELWSTANWIYTREDARHGASPGAFDATFWRRTDAPAEWVRITNVETQNVGGWAWTDDGGWQKLGGVLRALTDAEMDERLNWWPGEIYVMYVRFARNDSALRLDWVSDQSFRVIDVHDGRDLGVFGVDANGELATWGYGDGAERVDYVYGPLKQFGAIALPAWGGLTNGAFRFSYTDARLSADRPDIDFAPPAAP